MELEVPGFYCYLFRQGPLEDKFGHDAFTKAGFRTWKNAYHAFPVHVGGPNSCHNRARTSCDDFRNENASLTNKVVTYKEDAQARYELHLTLCIARFLISQGLAFRGHDESQESSNRGNFIELLKFFSVSSEEVNKYVLNNALCNCTLTGPKIQKQVINKLNMLVMMDWRGSK